jgi:hypothetical protein
LLIHIGMPDIATIAWIAVLVAAGSAATGALKLFFRIYDERRKRKPHQGFSAPDKTLQIAARPRDEYWWRLGKRENDPTMQIVGTIVATNVSRVPVRVTHAELRHGLFGRKRISGTAMVSGSTEEKIYGAFDIPPDESRDLTFDFWMYPPVRDSWETFTPHSLAFIDQFGNKHTANHITFQARSSSTSSSPNKWRVFLYELG